MLDEMKNRKQFTHDGRVIYEWEQNLESILLYIEPPPIPENLKLKNVLDIKIRSNLVSVGIKGNPPYLAHETAGVVDSEESLWYVNESPKDKNKKQIVIEIQKAQKAMNWGCVFKGHKTLNPVEEE